MTRIEYDLMTVEYPELNFPEWHVLADSQKNYLFDRPVNRIVQNRRSFLMSRTDRDMDWTENNAIYHW